METAPEVVFIFGDESGTLVDPRDVAVVVALIATTDPDQLRFIIRRAWRKYGERKGKRRPIHEFKFHDVEEIDRRRVLKALSEAQAEFVVLVVEKGEQKIPDTPENYGILLAEAIETCRAYYPAAKIVVTLDRHFSKPAFLDAVSERLVQWLSLSDAPKYADSRTSPIVQLADFVAGAFHRKHTSGDGSLAVIVRERIVEQRILRWQELKRKWLTRRK